MAAKSAPRKTRKARPVAILGGNRIPFAKADGPYAQASNHDMLIAALDGLISRFGMSGQQVDEFIAGAVLKHSRDFNLAREAVIGSSLSSQTPASDIQRACTTSLEAVVNGGNKIALGQADSIIAGGVDTASDAPLALNDDFRHVLLKARRAKGFAGRIRAFGGVRPKQVVPEIPRNAEPRTGLSMGEHAARTALEWQIEREAQDELALSSHHNLAAAYDENFFDNLMTGFLGQTRDQILRPDSTLEKLAKLRPVFGGETGTMTAGNSSALSDGAATVLLGSEAWAKEHEAEPLAYLIDSQVGAVDFVHGPDGLLMAPVYAVPKLLQRNGLTFDDFDFFEIHEAFASQVLATLKAWEDEEFCQSRLGLDGALGSIDRAKLNVAGSSLATGHPFAATGARIVATLAKLLQQRGSGRGLISVCAAGGQGLVAIVER